MISEMVRTRGTCAPVSIVGPSKANGMVWTTVRGYAVCIWCDMSLKIDRSGRLDGTHAMNGGAEVSTWLARMPLDSL